MNMKTKTKTKPETNTMKTITRLSLIAVAGAASLALASCSKESTSEASSEESAAVTADPKIEAVFLESAPAGAVTILETRKKVEPGATVTVSGRIAGAKEPFSKDYATLVLADESLETCEKIPGDGCSTPWDACCVAPKTIAASRITVQVLGDDGKPVAQSLKQIHGLKELDSLIVTGTVAEGSSDENVIVNATGIFPTES